MTIRCPVSITLLINPPARLSAGMWVISLLVLAGCSDRSSKAGSFEVNGFVCASTGEKFYTDEDVFPDHCPGHEDSDFVEVVAFVFSNGETVLGPRADAAVHPRLGERSTGVRFPTEDELVEWGATRKSKEEVTLE